MQFNPNSCSFWILVSHFFFFSFPFLLEVYFLKCYFWTVQKIQDLFSLSQSPNCLIIFFLMDILHIFSSFSFMPLLPVLDGVELFLLSAVSFVHVFFLVIPTSFFCSFCFSNFTSWSNFLSLYKYSAGVALHFGGTDFAYCPIRASCTNHGNFSEYCSG